jgi:superfamily I DNA/RNA helicase
MTERVNFPTVAQAKLFSGAAYTGKTQSLLLEILDLLRENVDVSEMLVFCATPDAAQNFSARLQALCPRAKELEITTPRAFFLDLLGTGEVCAATGRKARLLLPFEYDFFLEDLKTSGVRPHRLREILKFFYKGLSELADDDEEWLVTNEECELFSLIKEYLTFTGAILEPELANLAVNYLRSHKGAWEEIGRGYLFVDDFQLLSRASQFASCLLAKECIYLSADQNAAVEVYESYPYSDGMDEFIRANPHAAFTHLTTSHSCYSGAKASCALRQENGIDVSGMEYAETEKMTGFQLIEGENPQDEITQIVDAVEQSLNSGFSAHDIVIAVPHPVWMQNILRQLKARGVPAEILPDVRFLKGDIRSNKKCFNARFLTVLSLVADPTDTAAWRSWCGFDDYLANSNGMNSLRNFGQVQGKTLDVVLETSNLPQDSSEGLDTIASIQRIMKARDLAHTLIKRLNSLSGQNLLEAIAKELAESGSDARVPEEIKSLATGRDDDGENASAVSMVRRIRARLEFPVYSCNDVVRVTSYEKVTGMDPQYLFLAGFMNGFFPKHDYFDATVLTVEQMTKRYAHDLSSIASVVAKASNTLVVSYCKRLDLEDAERLKLVINRIVFENGKRVAKTEPSIFLKFMDV